MCMMGHIKLFSLWTSDILILNCIMHFLQHGNTPLHRAVVSSQKDVIEKLLLCTDIDVNSTNDVSCTNLKTDSFVTHNITNRNQIVVCD